MIIAAVNLFLAFVPLIAVPILMLVPGIVRLGGATSEAPIVGAALLIPITAVCILATPSILAGLRLLKKKSWGNVFAVTYAALHIASIPVGTALAIYTFRALAQKNLGTRD